MYLAIKILKKTIKSALSGSIKHFLVPQWKEHNGKWTYLIDNGFWHTVVKLLFTVPLFTVPLHSLFTYPYCMYMTMGERPDNKHHSTEPLSSYFTLSWAGVLYLSVTSCCPAVYREILFRCNCSGSIGFCVRILEFSNLFLACREFWASLSVVYEISGG